MRRRTLLLTLMTAALFSIPTAGWAQDCWYFEGFDPQPGVVAINGSETGQGFVLFASPENTDPSQVWWIGDPGTQDGCIGGIAPGSSHPTGQLELFATGGMICLKLEITVTVENRPTAQYEQVDLAWYYNDGHMVKLGQELVDGKLCIVMGREERDQTRTVKIVPLDAFKVQLRYLVKGNSIRGQFRPADSGQWQEVGECDLPAPEHGKPKISLQFYQGPADAEHWARVSEFRVERS